MKKVILLILIIVLVSIIFLFSSKNGEESTIQSTNFINSTILKVVSIFDKDLTDLEKEEIIEKIIYPVRKMAHMSEYFLLCVVVCTFISLYTNDIKKIILISLLCCILFASFDEIHQIFVSGRDAKVIDVIFDTISASIYLLIYYLCKRKERIA